MWKYLIPQIAFNDLGIMVKYMLIGALIAGGYGILHDQITYMIGPEYFHNFKFNQFAYADFGLGNRIFVGTIGFLATWWVGAIVGWILARRMIPACPREIAYRKIMRGFTIVFATAITFGIGGYLYGLYRGPEADYSYWHATFRAFRVVDTYHFICVGYIHNAGYLGGLLGIVLTYFFVKPCTTFDEDEIDR